MIYLDYAAATPLDERVEQAMAPYARELFYNPSATYLPARQVRAALDTARARVAHWLGARPAEVIFVAGGTEGNNLAISGVLAAHPGSSAVVGGVEHESVLAPAMNFNCFVALTTEQGRVDLDDLRRKIRDDTILVSVMYANNEVGTLQPLRQIATMLEGIRTKRRESGNALPLYLHTDACQATNYLDLHVSRLGVDLMTLNGGKVYGPKQSGVLYVASHVVLEPLVRGGGQERGLRSGTENVVASIGFAEALSIAQEMRSDEVSRLSALQHEAFRRLEAELPGVIVNGSRKSRLPNNIHVTLPGFDNERLLVQLEQAGILAAAGSACSASDEEPSHVLRAMGLGDEAARNSLRFTMGRGTTHESIDQLVSTLRNLTTS